MFEELNEQLAKVKKLLENRQEWNDQLANYQVEIKEKQQDLADLAAKIDASKQGMEKLDKFSFVHLKAVLTGSKDEKIYEIRNQIADAQYDYDEVQQEVSQIETPIREIQEKIDALPDIDSKYQNIMEKKEALIMDAHPLLKKQYVALNEDIAELKSTLADNAKIISAGKKAEASLAEAVKKIKKAEKWNVFVRSRWIRSVKHQHIMNAKESIHIAQRRTKSFHNKLLNVHKEIDLKLDIQGLLTFANFFFDSIFMDTVIQEKIDEAFRKISDQQTDVIKILHHLNYRQNRRKEELQDLKTRLKSLVENAEDW